MLVFVPVGCITVEPHAHPPAEEISLQLRNRQFAGVKHARRETSIHAGICKRVGEMIGTAGTSRRDQRNVAHLPCGRELLGVVPGPHTIVAHAVEDDFSRSTLLYLGYPR